MKKGMISAKMIVVLLCISMLFTACAKPATTSPEAPSKAPASSEAPASSAPADDFPSKPFTYVVAFAAGGESDVTARMQQEYFEKVSGQKFVVDYKEGGGGAIGWAHLVRSTPDGYTFAGVNEPHTIVQPLQNPNAGFKTEELARIALFQYTPRVIIVPASSPYNTLADLIEDAKKNPDKVVIGGSGTWSASHIVFLLLQKQAGIKATYMPYSGNAEAKSDVLGGHISAYIANNTESIELGSQVKTLAIASEARSNLLPNVPTFKEQGFQIVEGSYRGVAAPPGTPKEKIDKLADIFKQINDNPEFKTKMTEMGFDVIWLGPEEYDKFIAEKKVIYEELMKEFK